MFRLKFYALIFAVLLGLSTVYDFDQTARAQAFPPGSEQISPNCTMNQVVANGFDAGAGSLRQAVIDACAGGTITFSAAMPPTVSLSSGQIVIDKNLTIAGPGAESMTIRNIAGAGPENRIFNVNNGVTATISGLTITGGNVSGEFGRGGGIINGTGNLTLANSVVTGNLALLEGGGVFNFGNLTVTGSFISENGGSSKEGLTKRGGGIHSGSPGVLTVTDSVVSFNNATDGGGIYINKELSATSLALTRSSIIGNIASKDVQGDDKGEGGGIYNEGATTLTNSTVRGNLVGFCLPYSNFSTPCPIVTSSGIVKSGGSLTLIDSTVADDIGNSLDGLNPGTYTVQNSIVAGSGANFTTGGIPDGFVNVPYGATLVPDRGAFAYSLMGGNLPNGISLATNGSVVSVSGTNDQTGTFYFSVKKTDGATTSVIDYSVRFYRAPAALPPGGCLPNPVVANRSAAGAGTLAQAISDACAGATITFGNAVVGKILSGITLGKNLTIAGPGADVLQIQGLTVNSGVTATVSGLTISARNALGILNRGNLTVADLTVYRNSGGGIYNQGSLTVTRSIVSENGYQYLPNSPARSEGGGIYNVVGGTLVIAGSTISGNAVASGDTSSGGGIFNDGTATITNSTVSGNRTFAGQTGYGGGIFNGGNLSLVNSTVAGNSIEFIGSLFVVADGCGIANLSDQAVNVRNSIIAGNTGGGRPGGLVSAPDFEGALNSQGYNLIGDTDQTTITGDTTGNILNTNARLAPLADNGGRTPTHALLSGSPAINAGSTATSPALDQRDASRVGAADIGAFELNNSANGGGFIAQLPDGVVQNFYSSRLVANRGAFTYSLTGGALPAGVSLSTVGGIVSVTGTPTASGVFNFSVTAADGANSFVTNYRLRILTLPGGSLDSADCSAISGWAWDPQQPNTPISVNIYADDNLIATVAADRFRQDLLDAGIGNGVHGFSVPTPANLKDGQPHQIRVRIASTLSEISGSPKTITCALPSDLTIAKTHAGNFTRGDVGRTYSITVSNSSGTGATSGTISVADTLPAGLTATNLGGAGWNCNFANLTCTRGDALAAGASFPAITLTVNVAANAPASVTNQAAVSGGGEINTGNNTASDPTTVNAPPAPGSGTGLRGEYYNSLDLTGAVALSRIDPGVNFDWGVGAPGAGVGTDNFSVRWSGQVEPAYTETYTFYTTTDDGVRLWIGGVQVINDWTMHAPVENSATVTLNAGQRYDIRLEYFEATGGAVARLEWSSANQSRQIIPADRLYPSARYSISGTVSYGNTLGGQPDSFVAGVNINLTGAANASTYTDPAGGYQLPNLSSGNYAVTPSKTGDARGINSLDATRIQQHLVGMTTLTANQLIAADTDGNGIVNSLDSTRIQQSLIGIQTANIIGQWKFAPGNRQYNALGGNQTAQNFQAILVGEVSGNWATAASFTEDQNEEVLPAAADQDQIAARFAPNLLTTENFAGDLPERTAGNADRSSDLLVKELPTGLLGVPGIQVSLPANASRSIGASVTIPVTLGAIPAGSSIESFDFSVFYNPSVLQPAAISGSSAGTLSANCSVLSNSPAAGRLIVSGACAQAILSGSGVLYNLTFTVVGAINQSTSLSFINPANATNTFQFNNGAPAAFTVNGQFIVLAPTAAAVSVAGRVSTADGRGLMNATVTLTDASGATRTARTGSFGYFRFENVQAGQTYVLNVSSKRYTFAPQVVLVQEDLTEINFTAEGGAEMFLKQR